MVANDWAMKAAEKWAKKARYEAGMYFLICAGSDDSSRFRGAGQGRASDHDGVVPRAEPRGFVVDVPGGSKPRSGCSHLAEVQARITNAAGVVALDDLDKSFVDLHVTQSHRLGCDSCSGSDGAWGARYLVSGF